MISKFCYKCGNEMPSNHRCNKCGTPAIEMPISENDQKVIQELQRSYEENPPSKTKGCLATIIIGLIMFGIPALFTFTEISYDSIIAKLLMMGILLLINLGVYKYRNTLSFKAKRFYNLVYRDERDFDTRENKCRKCSQLLVKDMIFCPRCGTQVGEDLPIDTRLRRKVSVLHDKAVKSSEMCCVNCGANVENSRFCAECGTEVEG